MKKMKSTVLKLEDKKKALVLVAHPDDEVIWMGGTIMRYDDVEWTVVSLCRNGDKDREPKFRRVCDKLGVRGVMDDVEDDDKMSLEESVAIFKKAILKNTKNKLFDICFTHNKNGEYGHARHKGVYLAVKELIGAGIFPVKEVFYFDYKKLDRKILPMVPESNCSHILELTHKEYAQKRKIVAEMYGYPYDGIDVNLCPNVEAFKKERVKN